jgi:peptidoglycan/LPS O-acetylase OafA/YrhL
MPSDLPVTGNTEHTRPENRTSYPALDGLRAIAVLMVFGQHYLGLRWGWTGVDIFFVLSGFLITGILYDTRNDKRRVRRFYIRRMLRIFPLYYAVMLAVLLTWPIIHWHLSLSWLVWPTYVGNFARFVHPYVLLSPLQQLADFQPTGSFHNATVKLYLGHFWSLCIEEQFYFVWPWLVFWVNNRRKLLWVCAAMLPIELSLRFLAEGCAPAWMLQNELLYRVTFFRLDSLLLGGLLALVLRGPAREALLRWSRRLLAVVVTAFVIIVFVSSMRNGQNVDKDTVGLALGELLKHHEFTWRLTLIDCVAALVVVAAIQPGTLIYRCLHIYPLRWLGRISYGFYVLHDIWHYQISSWLRSRGVTDSHAMPWNFTMTAMIALFLTTITAWLSFRFFESPFLELKERWASARITSEPPQRAAEPCGVIEHLIDPVEIGGRDRR